MLPSGSRVLAAVSGGADSVALLHILRELTPGLGVTLAGVAHLNHKRRGSASDEDEGFVAELAARFGLHFFRAEAGVLQGNLEQAMRTARRDFFAGLIRQGIADRVALAHTRDDQAETVLFRVMRGSGLSGLAGIHPMTDDGIVRPLLDVSRAEIIDFLRDRKETWREDASNRDPSFARNRIRGTLLPQLAREWNPQIGTALAQLADLAFEEERWWNAEMHRSAGTELDVRVARDLPRAVARRLVRRAIVEAKGDARGIGFEHIERILELIAKERGDGCLRLAGLEIRRSFDWVRFAKPAAVPSAPVRVEIPGTCESPDRGGRLHFELGKKGVSPPCDTLKAELCWRKIPEAVEVRGWQPGDRYRPLGEARDQTVADMFQRSRVPSWRRRGWPIVTSAGKILWVREFGAADGYAARTSERVLRIWEGPP
ncbi:MAG TPA: tRNA lysidine(34) synthetase TilS [Bryobacteraceae bacterium]|nr:tRNA lysidine(34) synthetase TilS [Bryobacteraceae bacterium]